jgi:hypothetical protein
MINIEELLAKHLTSFDTAPFLFIGSGFSRRYIGLEDWEGLLKKFCLKLPRDFTYYLSSAEGSLPHTATLMAEDFFDVWWNEDDDTYRNSREVFKDKVKDKSSPLKIEISNYIRDKVYTYGEDQKNDNEVSYLNNVVIDGIITTNWDLLIEKFFEDQISSTYVGQEELLFSSPKEIAEIYKIHGSSLDPNSLVLTSGDYKDFREKNPYLAAKLMTIFIEHPIVFIGYSMSDENIIELLQAIVSCMSPENLYKLKDRLIFVERDTDRVGDSFQTATLVLKDNTLTVTRILTNDYEKVYKGMSHLKRKIPAKVLRQMKSQIYEIVKTNDTHGVINAAIDFEGDYDPSQVEFYYGVGLSDSIGRIGYTGLSADELFKMIVLENPDYDNKRIVIESLPLALKLDSYIPVFKYFNTSGLSEEFVDQRVKTALQLTYTDLLTVKQRRELSVFRSKYNSIAELSADYEKQHDLFDRIIMLDPESIAQEELQQLIIENVDCLDDRAYGIRSKYRKLIRFYDLIFFKDK